MIAVTSFVTLSVSVTNAQILDPAGASVSRYPIDPAAIVSLKHPSSAEQMTRNEAPGWRRSDPLRFSTSTRLSQSAPNAPGPV